ncbi:hypothetical protein BaRGS_00031122 [Batillaria attramentaria]|uniref:Uncharacterized protein n=1 Tax=Batillaria attramentaria TaxID=370345 RepID=A0ABD0JSL8_9CAEN
MVYRLSRSSQDCLEQPLGSWTGLMELDTAGGFEVEARNRTQTSWTSRIAKPLSQPIQQLASLRTGHNLAAPAVCRTVWLPAVKLNFMIATDRKETIVLVCLSSCCLLLPRDVDLDVYKERPEKKPAAVKLLNCDHPRHGVSKIDR